MADAALVGTRGASAGSSVATGAGACSTGETLIAIVSYDPGVTVSSIGDTAGNTYTLIQLNTGGFGRLAAYRCENAAGHASNVLTVNFSGAAFATAHLVRCFNVGAAPYDSGSLVSATDSANPYVITSNALAQADNVVIACAEINRAGDTANYTSSDTTILSQEPDASSFWTSAVSKVVVASAAAVTATFSKASTADTNGLIIFAIKDGVIAAQAPTIKFVRNRLRPRIFAPGIAR